MSEEKIKKKLNCQLFFLVGLDSCTSEDSSTIEYSASALTFHAIMSVVLLRWSGEV